MESLKPDRPLRIIFWLMLAAALWSWSLAWKGSLFDAHTFRQTQTAITAHWIKEDGFRLDYETPLFGPPWSIPLEFPLYQWSAAQLSRVSGLPLEQSCRAISILFVLGTLPAVFLLAGLARVHGAGRLLVVATVLSCPIYLFYGRSVMIETTALCFAIWFLVATGLAIRDLSWRWSVIAAISGTLAALTKVTTFALFGFPAAALALWFGWTHWSTRREDAARWSRAVVLGTLPVLGAVAVGAWWVRHTDAVKSTNPFSHFLRSTELTAWNWGTLEQRLSGAIWQEFWRNLSQSVIGEPALVVLLVCVVVVVPAWWRRWAAVGAAAFVLGPLVFINLYYRHDYYYCANSLLLMLSAGLLLAGMWASPLLPRGAKMMLLGVFFSAQLLTFYRGLGYNHRRELPQPPEIATVIRQAVTPDGVILIYGWDWNSLIPYYAQRRAISVPGGREEEGQVLLEIIAKLPPRRIAAMLVHRELFDAPAALIQERTARFGLMPTPVATSQEGDLYLTKEAADQLPQKLLGKIFQQVSFPAGKSAGAQLAAGQSTDLSAVDLSMVNPSSSHSHSLFGISRGNIGTQLILNAHAPAEIWVTPPPGAKHLSAEFGLNAGAYTGNLPYTDGIGVTISEKQLNGPPRIVFRRELDPVNNSNDRGGQKIELDNAEPFTGEMLFQFDAGPNGKMEKDWAYWAHIEVR